MKECVILNIEYRKIVMKLEEIVLKEALKKIDIDKYQPQITEAIESYFSSEEFKESIAEGLQEEGIAWEIVSIYANSIRDSIKNIKI